MDGEGEGGEGSERGDGRDKGTGVDSMRGKRRGVRTGQGLGRRETWEEGMGVHYEPEIPRPRRR